MEELFSLFNEMSENQRRLILETPTLLDAFCSEASEKIGIDVNTVKAHLSKLSASIQDETERVIRLSKSFSAVKDKSIGLIERQNDREVWFDDLIISPLIIAYAVKDLMESGMNYLDAIEKANSTDYEFELEKIGKRLRKSHDLSPLVMKPKLIRWDDGSSQKQREKKARIYHEILTLIKDTKQSMTKTQILRVLNKDNSSWRALCGEVLNYMVSREILILDGAKYSHVNNFNEYEKPYHRSIYELIADSPVSKTSILKTLGYNNKKGRAKLNKALNVMLVEGLVDTDGTKWYVPS
jgi:predicted transcriptional regulator|tara:strand:- start:987 stop:1874 length:888 start_codon:yes stop_codon:yes gene_type:complete